MRLTHEEWFLVIVDSLVEILTPGPVPGLIRRVWYLAKLAHSEDPSELEVRSAIAG